MNICRKLFGVAVFAATVVGMSQEVAAQNKPVIKSVDFTLPIPKPGQSLFDAREFQFTSAKTEYGDLAPSGEIASIGLAISTRTTTEICFSVTDSTIRCVSNLW